MMYTTVVKMHPFTGEINTIEVAMEPEAFHEAEQRWRQGVHIQDAFPTLSPAEREFMMTGMPEDDFDALWPENESENIEV